MEHDPRQYIEQTPVVVVASGYYQRRLLDGVHGRKRLVDPVLGERVVAQELFQVARLGGGVTARRPGGIRKRPGVLAARAPGLGGQQGFGLPMVADEQPLDDGKAVFRDKRNVTHLEAAVEQAPKRGLAAGCTMTASSSASAAP